jgi:hypothetical protein
MAWVPLTQPPVIGVITGSAPLSLRGGRDLQTHRLHVAGGATAVTWD